MGNHQMRRCAHCGSTLTQAGLDCIQCLACGELTHATGVPIAPTPKFVVEGTPGLPNPAKEE